MFPFDAFSKTEGCFFLLKANICTFEIFKEIIIIYHPILILSFELLVIHDFYKNFY